MTRVKHAFWVVCLLAFAGCADSSEPVDEPLVTNETGLIRGVVVDASITPVTGADVQILGGDNATTDADGAFLFPGLSPGSYQLRVSKEGFFSVQQAVQVEAGNANPDVAKFLLERDVLASPFVEEVVFEGFVGQAFTVAGARAGNSDAPDIIYERVPDFMQVEMTWESTQALGDGMEITLIAFEANSTTGDGFAVVRGESPIHVNADKATLLEKKVGGDNLISPAIFSYPNGAAPVSLTVDQPFTLFMHHFYAMTPPEGWTFVADGPVNAG